MLYAANLYNIWINTLDPKMFLSWYTFCDIMFLIPEAQKRVIISSCHGFTYRKNVEYLSLLGGYAVPAGKIMDILIKFVAFICTVKQSEKSKITFRFTCTHRNSMGVY